MSTFHVMLRNKLYSIMETTCVKNKKSLDVAFESFLNLSPGLNFALLLTGS